MMRTAAVIGLLLSSLLLSAQSDGKTQPTVLKLPDQTLVPACPIGMHARQGVWDHTITIHNGQDRKALHPFGQRFFLTLKDAHPVRIISATLRVQGLTGKSRAIPTNGAAHGRAEGTRIVTARFTAEDGAVLADVYVPGFTSVSSVELQEVTYADGSTWRISASSVCRTTPDPFMLIAEH